MRTILIVFPLILIISGCVSFKRTDMVNPETGKERVCSTSGHGIQGMISAEMQHSNCIDDAREMGYIPLDELTLEQKEELGIK